NRLCGSGLDAVMYAARAIAVGEGDVFIAGGTESMTRAPLVMAKPSKEFPRGNMELYDTTIGWRFVNPHLEKMYGTDSMPQTAENVAIRYGISREEQDAFAYESQMRAQKAMVNNQFADELVPVIYQDKKGNEIRVDRDEHPRPETSMEKLGKLRPLFDNGTITAGNASGVNDGASALLLMSADKAKELGLKPLARIVGGAIAGCEPAVMGLGLIYAAGKLLKRTGRAKEEVGIIWVKEACGSVSI